MEKNNLLKTANFDERNVFFTFLVNLWPGYNI